MPFFTINYVSAEVTAQDRFGRKEKMDGTNRYLSAGIALLGQGNERRLQLFAIPSATIDSGDVSLAIMIGLLFCSASGNVGGQQLHQ